MKSEAAVILSNIHKTYRRGNELVKALRGVDLSVPSGEIFGFLGPNGAGKTTALRILTTLLPFEEGEAYVSGINVRSDPQAVRRAIGYVSQKGGGDGYATGWENLLLQGSLYGIDKPKACQLARELVQAFSLEECIHRLVDTYSGGQRRRLDIALAMMHQPKILFLDEPTTGLDPQSRDNLWNKIRQLKQGGITIFLTSHYLDEVDALADSLAIMDHGTIVAEGSPAVLKKEISGDLITLGVPARFHTDIRALLENKSIPLREIISEDEALLLYVDKGSAALPSILRALDSANIHPETIHMSAPSLNDVFLKKTGRSLREGGAS